MLGVLLSLGAMAIIGVVIPSLTNVSQTYGSKLEQYIVSHNPQDVHDVERLTREFDEKQQRQGII